METTVITDKAINRLSTLLGLLAALPNSQNWEAEVSKPIDLTRYIDCYETEELNSEEKFALMSLILYALEGAEKLGSTDLPLSKDRIASIILADYTLHEPHIRYWSLPDEESDDPDSLFAISPFLREIYRIHGLEKKE